MPPGIASKSLSDLKSLHPPSSSASTPPRAPLPRLPLTPPNPAPSTFPEPSSLHTTPDFKGTKRSANSPDTTVESAKSLSSETDIEFPSSLLDSYVEELRLSAECSEQEGLGLMLQDLEHLQGICSMEVLKSAMAEYYKPEYINKLDDVYFEIGIFQTLAEVDWYFEAAGILLEEVVVNISRNAFENAEQARNHAKKATEDREASESKSGAGGEKGGGEDQLEASGRREGEDRYEDSGTREGGDDEGGDRDKAHGGGGGGGNGGGGGGSGAKRLPPLPDHLPINPIPVSFDHQFQRTTFNARREDRNVYSFHNSLAGNFASAIKLLLPNIPQILPATSSPYYHVTTKDELSFFRRRGITPSRQPNHLSSAEAFYVGNSLPDCILYGMMKRPNMERTRPHLVVLCFEIEQSYLEDVPGKEGWVVLDYQNESLSNLQEIAPSNISSKHGVILGTEQRDVNGEGTGKLVPVDVVVGPWLIKAAARKPYEIEDDWGHVGLTPLQYGFCSPRSWEFLNGKYSMAFIENWDFEVIAAPQNTPLTQQ